MSGFFTLIRQATVNGKRPAWYLQLDIRNYFMRIDRDILYRHRLPRLYRAARLPAGAQAGGERL